MGESRLFRLHVERVFVVISMFCAIATLAVLVGSSSAFGSGWVPRHADDDVKHESSSSLAQWALQKVLDDASPVFGGYKSSQKDTATWMKAYPDNTLLTHLNIPGAHDAATWNYTEATQQSLDHITQLIDVADVDSTFYQTQDLSIVNALNAGIRVFDLRYAYDVTNTSLVFWHALALQSETATVDDVLFGYYRWLEDHPSEVVFLSFQYEGGGRSYAVNDIGVQTLLFKALSSPAARRYILQSRKLGTLGGARGKIVLLKRFDLDLLPASYSAALPGLQFSPSRWTDNGANITLVYNDTTSATAYIEDYYDPQTAQGSSAEENIQSKVRFMLSSAWGVFADDNFKLNATESHLHLAATAHPDDLFWSFASSRKIPNDPPSTPKIQALGNGSLTPLGGVNQQLIPFFKSMRGKRLGIVMFDFYETPSDLITTFLSVLPPKEEH